MEGRPRGESGSDIKEGEDKYRKSQKLKQLLGKIKNQPKSKGSDPNTSSEAFSHRVIQSVRNYNYLVQAMYLVSRVSCSFDDPQSSMLEVNKL